MEMIEQEREGTSSTETALTFLDDYPRPRPSWQSQMEENEQMTLLLNRVEMLFEGKRRLAA
jgi:hypothetical protein